ncbi:MAG: hypothetical protein GXP34_00400 [Actinobacteria bacterium]|nr:hypothetical protein [Actinomycetota bacterium]
MRRLIVTILVMAMIMTMAAAPAVATPGSDYFATRYCTIYQGVFIYSRAAG